MLRLTRLRSTADEARLDAYVWGGRDFDFAIHRRRRGDEILVRSRITERDGQQRRTVERFALGDERPVPLDRTVFELGRDHFAEVALHHAGTGNLHAAPIVLPACLRLGHWHQPFAQLPARVGLSFVGRIALGHDGDDVELDAICLAAEQAGQRRIQWPAKGIGELCIGGSDEEFDQWLIACQGVDRALFGGVPVARVPAELPRLVTVDDAAGRSSLF